ncbi:DUF4349 domain-containing protein [Cohnella hongkongensis]|uniref:DUF4349 domain-containing protein n=1 Tax=Cohnella hongkongensis TaxID=178337 RepID=A0ABV9FBR3_9BACL
MKGKQAGTWHRRLLLAVAAMLLATGLAACSGSASDSGAPKSEMSMADQAAPALSEPVEGEIAAAPSMSAHQNAGAATTTASDGGGVGVGPIADANAGYGRKIIYRADLVMKVDDFQVAQEQLLDQIHLSGAYVLQFSDSRNANEVGATYVIKVPSEGFTSFLEKLQSIENLKFEREVKGSDVTEEFVDLEARLKTQTALEARYLDFISKATKTGDLVQFANELARVQETIEQIKGRMRYLDQNVAFSTVNLRLYQADGIEEPRAAAEKKSFGDRISDALLGSATVLRQLGEGLIVVLAAMLPVLIVAGALGVPAYAIFRGRSAARRQAAESKRKEWNRERAESGGDGETPQEEGGAAERPAEPEGASPEEESR